MIAAISDLPTTWWIALGFGCAFLALCALTVWSLGDQTHDEDDDGEQP